MAIGDIHNKSGHPCKAWKISCPLGENGHSKDIDSYVEYHVKESGVDGDLVRAMIFDGTPQGDAVEVDKTGLSSTGSSASKEEDQMNEETFGYIRELKGQERDEAIANAEAILARSYSESKVEVAYTKFKPGKDGLFSDEQLDDSNYPELKKDFRNQLAAIHGVPKDRVIVNSDGDIEVDRADGKVSIYNQNFELKGAAGRNYETDEGNAKNTEDAFGYIKKLKGTEREKAIAEAEASLASEYLESKYELKLRWEGSRLRGEGSSQVEKERDLRQLERTYREIHAVIDETKNSKAPTK